MLMMGLAWIFSISLSIAKEKPEEITGKVISVLDGNTLEVVSADNQTHKIFLADIDSPELNQLYGDKAKKLLEKLALNKEVSVRLKGKDRKGNKLAEVIVEGKTDLRIELLKEGLAWTAEQNPIPELEEYRAKAQEKGKGLWKQDDPTPPWTFRRQQTMLEAKSS
jgi:endonuclease YncB( thermonuclease family)